nr:hypothetical protein [Tanacetum cinerariifolium]
ISLYNDPEEDPVDYPANEGDDDDDDDDDNDDDDDEEEEASKEEEEEEEHLASADSAATTPSPPTHTSHTYVDCCACRKGILQVLQLPSRVLNHYSSIGKTWGCYHSLGE